MSTVFKQTQIQSPTIAISGSPYTEVSTNVYKVTGEFENFICQFPFDVDIYYSFLSGIAKDSFNTFRYNKPINVSVYDDRTTDVYILANRIQDNSQSIYGPYIFYKHVNT